MAEARCRQAWRHTSAVMALLANIHRDPKKTRPFRPADFDPYAVPDARRRAAGKSDLGALKDALLGRRTR
jgi:hypothetical protein